MCTGVWTPRTTSGLYRPRAVSVFFSKDNPGAMGSIAYFGDATGVTLTGRTSDQVICSHWMRRSP